MSSFAHFQHRPTSIISPVRQHASILRTSHEVESAKAPSISESEASPDQQRTPAFSFARIPIDPPTQAPRNMVEEHRENNTGLPDKLKAGIERLSGLSMDDVKVHYNSSKPSKVQALAFTRGTDIHVGPGQEKYLPHEAWHVVQQKQKRVQPTLQAKEGAINDDGDLEREADVMGVKAFSHANVRQLTMSQFHRPIQITSTLDQIHQRKAPFNVTHGVIQRGAVMSTGRSKGATVQVNVSGKGGENPMGHSSAEIIIPSKDKGVADRVVRVDSHMVGDGFEVVSQNPVDALRGKTNAEFQTTVSTQPRADTQYSVKLSVTEAQAEGMIERATKVNGKKEKWDAGRNCTSPVKYVLKMRQGPLFNTPTGTMVQLWSRTRIGRGLLAVTGGLAAYWAYQESSKPGASQAETKSKQ